MGRVGLLWKRTVNSANLILCHVNQVFEVGDVAEAGVDGGEVADCVDTEGFNRSFVDGRQPETAHA